MQPVCCTRREMSIAAGLFLATCALFWRAVPHGFVDYDDTQYVTANAHVRSGLGGEGVRWAFSTGDVSYWHPLTWLSHMADWSLFGNNPHGHHATNVILHGLNAALVFLVFRRLTGRTLICALLAALFAWHPLRVESVAWIAERKDVLSAAFSLGTVWMYAAYVVRRDASTRGAWRWYLGALLLFAAGLMSKPMVVSVPALLLILDFWPLRRLTRDRVFALLIEKVPFVILAGLVSWVTMVAQRNAGTMADALPLADRLSNAVVSVARYLGKIVAPRDLAVLYPHPGHWPAAAVVAAVLLVSGLTAIAVLQWRRRPWIIAGWAWFLVGLLPAIGIVQVGIQAMADRYTYLPALGIGFAVLWTLSEAAAAWRGPLVWSVASTAALASLALQTWSQLGVWRDTFTLFHHAIAVAGKGNYLAYNARGLVLYRAGRIDDAIADYQRSLAINSRYPETNNNYGQALAAKGRTQEAIPYYRKALSLNPRLAEAHNNLANALSAQRQLDEAIEHYETALRLQPGDVLFLSNYGAALGMAGRLGESLEKLREAAKIQPDADGLQANIGNVLARMGRKEEAGAQYRRALELDPDDARSQFSYGYLQVQMGRYAEAVPNLRRAVALAGSPDAYALLGGALVESGNPAEGIASLREALRLDPENQLARKWLAQVTGAEAGPR